MTNNDVQTIDTPTSHAAILKELGIESINPGACSGPGTWSGTGGRDLLTSVNPTTGQPIAQVAQSTEKDYENVMAAAGQVYFRAESRLVPAHDWRACQGRWGMSGAPCSRIETLDRRHPHDAHNRLRAPPRIPPRLLHCNGSDFR